MVAARGERAKSQRGMKQRDMAGASSDSSFPRRRFQRKGSCGALLCINEASSSPAKKKRPQQAGPLESTRHPTGHH